MDEQETEDDQDVGEDKPLIRTAPSTTNAVVFDISRGEQKFKVVYHDPIS